VQTIMVKVVVAHNGTTRPEKMGRIWQTDDKERGRGGTGTTVRPGRDDGMT
jgi:hypothetical protein